MKHKKVPETTKIDNKVTKPKKKVVINKLITYKTGTTCPDPRFMKNTNP